MPEAKESNTEVLESYISVVDAGTDNRELDTDSDSAAEEETVLNNVLLSE